jgi:competence ComEA-like helix-hairpin-helix protein
MIRYLYFSRLERLGTAAMLLLAVVFWLLPRVLAFWRPSPPVDFTAFEKAAAAYYASLNEKNAPEPSELFPFDPNTADAGDFRRLGLSPRVVSAILRYREKGGRFKKTADFKKIYLLPEEDYERLEPWIEINLGGQHRPVYASENKRFPEPEHTPAPFDPNRASEEELVQVGIPRAAARSIVNYRSKGGVFRKKEDLKKIYTLPEAVYIRLEPFIDMPAEAHQMPARPAFEREKRPPKTIAELDANLATVADWQNLPGIGAWRAQQITGYREKLGGFIRIEQVAEVKGLPDSVFMAIVPFLRLSTAAVRTIDLNRASVDDLEKHPYISAKQARLIVHYREQHGPFQSPEELLKLPAVVDKAWLERVRGYLEFGIGNAE